jgi:sporulation protein YlmC with PRC-barrel domain
MDGRGNGSNGTSSSARMALDQLPGRSVLDSTGRVIGRVDRAMVDVESWAVEALRVRLRRDACADLGLQWSPFRQPVLDVPTGLVLAARDAVILRAALDELASLAPGHEAVDSHPAAELPATH